MRPIFFLPFLLLISFGLSSCSNKEDKSGKQRIRVQQINGKYSILRDGKIFNIRGASGYTNLEELKRCGGNTIRIWDTTHIDRILADANRYGISVIVGISLPESQYLSYYNDTNKVSKDFNKIKKLVNQYKSNPALLMWCVGNELVFPNKPSYNSFYRSFNNIVEMIHQDDPDHPVTTTMVNFRKNDIVNIKLRTDVDIISFNIFSRITELKDDLKNFSWFWKGPYLITEWGINGPWPGISSTAWDAKIEPNSTIKAKDYLARYKEYMPVEAPRFLGSFIFFWGQKQEITHTWFSLFDEFGNKTESVSIAQEIWTGKPSNFNGPKISGMVLSEKGASNNIFLEPGSLQSAKINVLENKKPVNVKWEIYPEDWYKKNNVNNLIRPKILNGLIIEQTGLEVKFKAPLTEGPYRLFASVSDNKGNIANANIPFYVIMAHE
jgi:hypothetical protein